MAFSQRIQSALKEYDQKKGFFRRWGWLSWLFGKDSPAIRAVRALESSNQNTLFKLLQCFVQHKVKTSQASFLVFKAVLEDLFCSSLQNTPLTPKQYQDIIPPLLYNEDLFTEENIKDIHQHPHSLNLASALLALNKYPLLASEIRILLKESDHPAQVANLMIRLYNKQSFIQNNRCQLKESFDLEKIITIIKMLYKTKTLTEENITAIQERPDMETLSKALKILYDKQLLTQNHFNIIKIHTELSTLADLLQALDYKGLLTQKNFDAIFVQANINALITTLTILYDTPLLTQNNFDLLQKNLNLPRLNQILNTLSKVNLLTQDNFDLIVQRADLQNIAEKLSTFQETTFTQADFEKVIKDHPKDEEKTDNTIALTEEEFFDARAERSPTPKTYYYPSYAYFVASQPELQNNQESKLTHQI